MPETSIFQTTVQREILPRLPIRLIGLGMAGLLLTSCIAAQTPSGGVASSSVTETTPVPSPVESSTSQRTPNQTSLTPTSTLNPALSETCQLDTGSIYSGGKFNQGNSDDITNQLSALAVAKNNNPISFADTRHAASLLANATIDDKYAAGLTIANQAPVGAVPSVGELLVAVAALPPDACPSRTQLKEVGALYQTITDGYGPRIANQSKGLASETYRRIQNAYQELKKVHPDMLGPN